MDIRVLTLFPEMTDYVIKTSITGRAIAEGKIGFSSVNIRDFADNKYGKVDDSPYGGGTGMLMMCMPVYAAWEFAAASFKEPEKPRTIYLSPKGRVFDQKKAAELSELRNLIFLCGHYEGIDQRVIDEIVDEEISIGDFVLTGGEIAACAVIDASARLVPGVLPDEDAYSEESHMRYALEYPQYTKPAVWKDRKVPDVLLSGHHKNIKEWKRITGLYETMMKRPDLFEKMNVSEDEIEQLLRSVKSDTDQGSAGQHTA